MKTLICTSFLIVVCIVNVDGHWSNGLKHKCSKKNKSSEIPENEKVEGDKVEDEKIEDEKVENRKDSGIYGISSMIDDNYEKDMLINDDVLTGIDSDFDFKNNDFPNMSKDSYYPNKLNDENSNDKGVREAGRDFLIRGGGRGMSGGSYGVQQMIGAPIIINTGPHMPANDSTQTEILSGVDKTSPVTSADGSISALANNFISWWMSNSASESKEDVKDVPLRKPESRKLRRSVGTTNTENLKLISNETDLTGFSDKGDSYLDSSLFKNANDEINTSISDLGFGKILHLKDGLLSNSTNFENTQNDIKGENELSLGIQAEARLSNMDNVSKTSSEGAKENDNVLLDVFDVLYKKDIETLDLFRVAQIASLPAIERQKAIRPLADKYNVDYDTREKLFAISENPRKFLGSKNIGNQFSSIIQKLISPVVETNVEAKSEVVLMNEEFNVNELLNSEINRTRGLSNDGTSKLSIINEDQLSNAALPRRLQAIDDFEIINNESLNNFYLKDNENYMKDPLNLSLLRTDNLFNQSIPNGKLFRKEIIITNDLNNKFNNLDHITIPKTDIINLNSILPVKTQFQQTKEQIFNHIDQPNLFNQYNTINQPFKLNTIISNQIDTSLEFKNTKTDNQILKQTVQPIQTKQIPQQKLIQKINQEIIQTETTQPQINQSEILKQTQTPQPQIKQINQSEIIKTKQIPQQKLIQKINPEIIQTETTQPQINQSEILKQTPQLEQKKIIVETTQPEIPQAGATPSSDGSGDNEINTIVDVDGASKINLPFFNKIIKGNLFFGSENFQQNSINLNGGGADRLLDGNLLRNNFNKGTLLNGGKLNYISKGTLLAEEVLVNGPLSNIFSTPALIVSVWQAVPREYVFSGNMKSAISEVVNNPINNKLSTQHPIIFENETRNKNISNINKNNTAINSIKSVIPNFNLKSSFSSNTELNSNEDLLNKTTPIVAFTQPLKDVSLNLSKCVRLVTKGNTTPRCLKGL